MRELWGYTEMQSCGDAEKSGDTQKFRVLMRNSMRISKQLLNAGETPITDQALTPVSMIHLIRMLIRVLHLQIVTL